MSELKENFKLLTKSIHDLCIEHGRQESEVCLIGVSKKKPASLIEEAYQLGLKHFGENYVQELLEKIETIPHRDIHWHMIGHLQRRKVKDIIGRVAMIHSIDSIDLLEEIEKRAATAGIVQKGFLQINIANEVTKTGFATDQILDFMSSSQQCSHVDIVGLTIIPPATENPEDSRPYFVKLKQILDQINESGLYRKQLDSLSMGMSHDFAIAIAEGATHIRVGTALFGKR